MSTLHIERALAGDAVVLRIAGHLDLRTRRWLEDFVHGLPATDEVVVDLRRVVLCDAASMSTLIGLADAFRERGGWLRLAAPVGAVARVFSVVALGEIVPTYATVSAALAGDERGRIKD